MERPFVRYAVIGLGHHLPGAINLPLVDDAQFAEVGTLHQKDPHTAYLIGAEYASRNLSSHIGSHISKFGRDARFLVYCFRGGKRSRAWADVLRNIGFSTDVLKGGWKAYRGWVRLGLEALSPQFEYLVLSGMTGCGKTRLLHALDRPHAQEHRSVVAEATRLAHVRLRHFAETEMASLPLYSRTPANCLLNFCEISAVGFLSTGNSRGDPLRPSLQLLGYAISH
jgi:rhodanese-related sulfurtransferase